MIKCDICKIEFKNNLGGNLTKHLKETHNMSMEDYVILIKYNGIDPKCSCRLCNEKPFFERGKFSKYALNHNKHEWLEKKYKEIFNKPKCLNCDKDVIFYRGIPRKFCSSECAAKYNGNNWNQDKINITIKDKYNVDNVFQIDDIKKKSKKTMLEKYGVEYYSMCDNYIKKINKTSNKKFGVDFPLQSNVIKEKIKKTLLKKYGVTHNSKTDNFRINASKRMCEYNQNLSTNHKIKRYKETTLYYQSLYELRFIEYCENNYLLSMLENSITFKYLDKKYGNWHLPDFKYNKKYIIEIKSTYWMNRQGGMEIINAKRESVEKLGYTYIFMLDEDYSEFFKIIKF